MLCTAANVFLSWAAEQSECALMPLCVWGRSNRRCLPFQLSSFAFVDFLQIPHRKALSRAESTEALRRRFLFYLSLCADHSSVAPYLLHHSAFLFLSFDVRWRLYPRCRLRFGFGVSSVLPTWQFYNSRHVCRESQEAEIFDTSFHFLDCAASKCIR